jgi:hypothetical protein
VSVGNVLDGRKAEEHVNLNEEKIRTSEGDGVSLRQYPLGLDVSVYFRDIKERLIGFIAEADYVFGCVAWLTDYDILAALSEKRGVSIVVQKEDFLRPDSPGWSPVDKSGLRNRYELIPGIKRRFFATGVAGELSTHGDPGVEAVRCAGICRSKGGITPKMHHKFAVFCKARGDHELDGWALPYGAFTGSYNWSNNANRSLENAVHIRDAKAAKAFYLEFQQVLALSEPLDWTSEYVEPEWRIGS